MLTDKTCQRSGPFDVIGRTLLVIILHPLQQVIPGERRVLLFMPLLVVIMVLLATVLPQEIDFVLASHMKPADCFERQKQRAMLPQRVRKLKSSHWSPLPRASLRFLITARSVV